MSVFYEQMVKAQMAEYLAEAQEQRPARQLVRAQRAQRRRARREARDNAAFRVALMRSRVARQH